MMAALAPASILLLLSLATAPALALDLGSLDTLTVKIEEDVSSEHCNNTLANLQVSGNSFSGYNLQKKIIFLEH